MQRRIFVATAVTTAVGAVAGCIGGTTRSGESTSASAENSSPPKRPTRDDSGTETTSITFEPTPTARVIPFDELSPEVQREVRIAIEEGSYRTRGGLALEWEVNRDSRIKYRGRFYRPLVAVSDCGTDRKSTCESVTDLYMQRVSRSGATFEAPTTGA